MLFNKRKPFVHMLTVASMSSMMAGCPGVVTSNPPPPDTDVIDTEVSDTEVSDTDESDTDE